MRILISGGLGFLGHHLCKRIFQEIRNPYITIIDNLSSSIIDYSWIEGRADIIIQDFRDYKPGNKVFD